MVGMLIRSYQMCGYKILMGFSGQDVWGGETYMKMNVLSLHCFH